MNPAADSASLLEKLVELSDGNAVVCQAFARASTERLATAIATVESTARKVARRGRLAVEWETDGFRIGRGKR